ncbi:MAG: colanic acid/amylovoran biosynthesis glycosyltransferase [Candidatus Binatia bacterium]
MKRNDRVAIVSEGLPFGGTTTLSLFLASGLRRLGAPVKVFSFTDEHPLKADFERQSIAVHTEPHQGRIYEDRLAGVYRSLAEFEPTAVLAFLSACSFETLRYVPKGVLRIGTIHDHHEAVYRLVGDYIPWIDQITVGCSAELDRAKTIYSETPSHHLTYGIPIDPNRPMRQSQLDEPIRILYFGRLQQSQKQVRIFPEIWRELKRRNVNFRWTIHGDGPEKDFLREQLKEGVNAGEVRFSVPVPYDELKNIIGQHDIYLLTSAHEGGPLTLLEAMAQGLVPVCGDIPCIVQDAVNSKNGIRVPFDDPTAYADAIATLACDRQRTDDLSAEAVRTAETDHSEIALAQRYLDFLADTQPELASPAWPDKIVPKPIVSASPLKFHPLVRPLRRLAKRLKPRA